MNDNEQDKTTYEIKEGGLIAGDQAEDLITSEEAAEIAEQQQ
jgi:hypothetical protein